MRHEQAQRNNVRSEQERTSNMTVDPASVRNKPHNNTTLYDAAFRVATDQCTTPFSSPNGEKTLINMLKMVLSQV
jgi:hypothetical protein